MSKSKFAPKVTLMPLENIKPYDKNAKVHTETQIEALVKVIKSQGWDVPIVVDKDGVVIKGHGRRLAALSMGLKEVPVIVRDDLTEAQVKAARLSDNRVAMGDFDVDAIKEELEDLKSDGFDLDSMGFDEKEVKMMLGDLDTMDFEALTVRPSATTEHAGDETSATNEQPDPDAPKMKAILVVDALGFKHIPGEYKADLVEFQAQAEQASDKMGAEAFCELIRRLLNGMTSEN